MKVEGRVHIRAPRDRVWELFNDPQALKNATPGCERLEEIGPDTYEATLKLGVAAVRGTYTGRIQISDKQPPERYTLSIEGSGGPGFVKAQGPITFQESGDGTDVLYAWDVQAGGMIAGVGQRVLGGVAKWMIGEFFKAMERQVLERMKG